MGIVAFNWAEDVQNKLMLVMNRDNWENRVISGASWNGDFLSGAFQVNGGTWFGISKQGRVAFLVDTYILIDHVYDCDCPEEYPIDFLRGNKSPQQFANYVANHEKEIYDDSEPRCFSLIVADMTSNSMVHIYKPEEDKARVVKEPVPFGVHTLSPFGGLDSEVPRALRLKGFFNKMIDDFGIDELPPLDEIAQKYMYNSEGEGSDAVFIDHVTLHPNEDFGYKRYGTTSTTVMVVESGGEVALFERYRDETGAWNEHDCEFKIRRR